MFQTWIHILVEAAIIQVMAQWQMVATEEDSVQVTTTSLPVVMLLRPTMAWGVRVAEGVEEALWDEESVEDLCEAEAVQDLWRLLLLILRLRLAWWVLT